MHSLIPLLRPDRRQSLHLPVHGRGRALPPALIRLLKQSPGSWDLPELPEIGGPLENEGAVADAQERLASQVGVGACWFGVNGATGLLQAALSALAGPGQAVLMPRNAHRSLIAACVLGGIRPVFLPVPFLSALGHPGAMSKSCLEDALKTLPSLPEPIVAAVLVHPTYHGYAVDPTPLIAALHRRGWPVLVDEAHGTHFAFSGGEALPCSSIQAGADLVVHSLHKSAPGLGQTAVLWLQGMRVSSEAVSASLLRFQTSSPSALLLASCEATLNWMLTPAWERLLHRRMKEAHQLADRLGAAGLPLSRSDDPLRLILVTAQAGISGLAADNWFMERGLIAELPEPLCLTFCLGLASQRGLAKRMKRLWRLLQFSQPREGVLAPLISPPLETTSTPELLPAKAVRAPACELPLVASGGRIAAEMICPYPPGIPLLIPGERIGSDRLSWLLDQHQRWPELVPGKVKVLAEEPQVQLG
ncbi:MAG: lysine decarboxylase [Synechococcus sp. NP17]|nr:lysine decarboxylase [Synechococcus sp. NP17]